MCIYKRRGFINVCMRVFVYVSGEELRVWVVFRDFLEYGRFVVYMGELISILEGEEMVGSNINVVLFGKRGIV